MRALTPGGIRRRRLRRGVTGRATINPRAFRKFLGSSLPGARLPVVLGVRPSSKEVKVELALALEGWPGGQSRAQAPTPGRSQAEAQARGRQVQGWRLVDSFQQDGVQYVVAREEAALAGSLLALTGREREIVLQAAAGASNKEIAHDLGISDATVRVLMSRAANRLGVRKRKELLAHPALLALGEAPSQSAVNDDEG